VYLLRETSDGVHVLLGEKLTGLGTGKFVGAGGKLESGESPAEAAVRELAEELGVTVAVNDLEPISCITYPFVDRDEWSQRSYGFAARTWHGEPHETEELRPAWFPLDAIPFERMWADAAKWLPTALAGEFVERTIPYRADGSLA
jgi:8-oxo-dGTP pyrophosphatase MutT (NUDIX family)